MTDINDVNGIFVYTKMFDISNWSALFLVCLSLLILVTRVSMASYVLITSDSYDRALTHA